MDRVCNRVLLAVLLIVTVGGSAQAAFNASDLVFLPVAAHNEGVENSVWRTDVHLTNVDEVDIDIATVFLPSGLASNGFLFLDRTRWLGGREEDGFGKIEEQLASIPPGGTVVLHDVLGTYWLEELPITGSGAMAFFAYESGTLEADGSRTPSNIVMSSRTYNETTIWVPDTENDDQFIEQPATYGQVIPGVPWYQLADAGNATVNGDFSFETLNISVVDPDFRYNVGVFNASDSQTSITFEIKPFDLAGEPFLAESGNEISLIGILPPLSHIQYTAILRASFLFDDEDEVGRITVRVLQWTTTSPNPKPRFTSYGSLVDSRSNDPLTVLPSFEESFNIDCIWEPEPEMLGVESRTSGAVLGGRSLDFPPR